LFVESAATLGEEVADSVGRKRGLAQIHGACALFIRISWLPSSKPICEVWFVPAAIARLPVG
jgi:hypothetical protein